MPLPQIAESDADASPCFLHGEASLYCASSLNRDTLPEESVDLFVTSPPYNVGIEYKSNEDGGSYEEYLAFSEQWIANAYFWAKDKGRLCLNIVNEERMSLF